MTSTKPTSILWELIDRLANTTLSIRITGEAGTGKAEIARLLSSHYPHQDSVFIEFNCKSIELQSQQMPQNPSISQSRDAFLKILDTPQNHVLYLKHIEYLPAELQSRLCQVFEHRYSTAPPWVIATSTVSLINTVQESEFNPALFKALDTVHITLPPLRSKPENIPQILYWLMTQNACEDHSGRPSIPDMATVERLIEYHWPGNWRQLQRVTQAAFKAKGWNFALNSFSLSSDQDESQINDMAAIYILSLAKLNIQKERVIEGLMASSNLDEIGLLDLAIFHEAVNQMADTICGRNPDQSDNPDYS